MTISPDTDHRLSTAGMVIVAFETIRTMFERVTEVIQAIRETAPTMAEIISEPVGVERVR